MLSMKQKVILVVLISALTAVLAAGLIRATFTYNVELVSSPSGPVIYAAAKEPFNISCQVLGGDANNVSSMKWLGPKGNDIGEGNPRIVKSENNLLYLIFTDPKRENSGIYKCAAKYAKNYNLQYAVNIVFYGPAPEFDHDFENGTYTEGDSVKLHCFARGETPMTYTWHYESGDLIKESKSISISKSSNESYLVIDNVQRSDEGMYSCNAENSHGLSSKFFHVIVIRKSGNNDTSVSGDFKVVNVNATSVQFEIAGTGLEGYVEVKYSESREGQEYQRRLSLKPDNIYTIDNLIPGGLYSFQFRVVSSKGNGSGWSRQVRVTLLPDTPDLIIRRQEKGILELEWFRKVDDIMRETVDKHEISYYTLSIQAGNTWIRGKCAITIQVPSCSGSRYTISGLRQGYYQIEVRAHTDSGYGEPATQKIYISA